MDERYLHEYTLNGSQIVKETVYSAASDDEYSESYTIVYIYDETGAPIGMKYRTPNMAVDTYACFFFEKNMQGDIVSVYNSIGVKVIAYTYDAWGNCTASYPNGYSGITGATYNPFRYRGYYYDIETGFYYLQSRYYNPTWGRFLNADNSSVLVMTPYQLTDKNLYAYCDNNPVIRVDEDGEFWNIVIGAIAGGLIGAAISIVDQLIFEGEVDVVDVLIDAGVGVLTGIAASVVPTAAFGVNIALNAVASAGQSIYTDKKENEEALKEGRYNDYTSNAEIVSNAIISGGFSALFTYVGGASSSSVSRSVSKVAKDFAEETFGAFGEWICAKLIQGRMKGFAGW